MMSGAESLTAWRVHTVQVQHVSCALCMLVDLGHADAVRFARERSPVIEAIGDFPTFLRHVEKGCRQLSGVKFLA